MASLLESYEQQYSSITGDITSKSGRIPNLSGLDKKQLISQVEKHLEEANEVVEQMDLEVRDLPVDVKPKYQNRVKSYQAELKQLQKEFKKSCIAFSDEVRAREELFASDDLHSSEDQRARLLDNTESIERSTRRLEAGYKMCVETEQIGADTLDNLHSQRETLTRGRDRLRDTDSALGKSSRILTGMMRRIIQNRLLLMLIGVTIVIVIIVSIYLTATKNS